MWGSWSKQGQEVTFIASGHASRLCGENGLRAKVFHGDFRVSPVKATMPLQR